MLKLNRASAVDALVYDSLFLRSSLVRIGCGTHKEEAPLSRSAKCVGNSGSIVPPTRNCSPNAMAIANGNRRKIRKVLIIGVRLLPCASGVHCMLTRFRTTACHRAYFPALRTTISSCTKPHTINPLLSLTRLSPFIRLASVTNLSRRSSLKLNLI